MTGIVGWPQRIRAADRSLSTIFLVATTSILSGCGPWPPTVKQITLRPRNVACSVPSSRFDGTSLLPGVYELEVEYSQNGDREDLRLPSELFLKINDQDVALEPVHVSTRRVNDGSSRVYRFRHTILLRATDRSLSVYLDAWRVLGDPDERHETSFRIPVATVEQMAKDGGVTPGDMGRVHFRADWAGQRGSCHPTVRFLALPSEARFPEGLELIAEKRFSNTPTDDGWFSSNQMRYPECAAIGIYVLYDGESSSDARRVGTIRPPGEEGLTTDCVQWKPGKLTRGRCSQSIDIDVSQCLAAGLAVSLDGAALTDPSARRSVFFGGVKTHELVVERSICGEKRTARLEIENRHPDEGRRAPAACTACGSVARPSWAKQKSAPSRFFQNGTFAPVCDSLQKGCSLEASEHGFAQFSASGGQQQCVWRINGKRVGSGVGSQPRTISTPCHGGGPKPVSVELIRRDRRKDGRSFSFTPKCTRVSKPCNLTCAQIDGRPSKTLTKSCPVGGRLSSRSGGFVKKCDVEIRSPGGTVSRKLLGPGGEHEVAIPPSQGRTTFRVRSFR